MLIILLFFVVCPLPAQTDREILLELVKQQAENSKQIVEINKQIAEINKQQAVANARFEAKFEGIDKRFDILLYVTLGVLGGVFGIIVMIFWDRRAAMRPIEEKTQELKKEIALIKEKELKLEKRILRNENDFKRIAEIDTRFARTV